MLVAILVIVCVVAAAVLFRPRPSSAVEPVKPNLPRNNPPVAHDPLVIGGAMTNTLFLGDSVKLDLRHRVHGCDANGNPLSETGAYDPEGDVLEYCVTCSGPSADGVQIPFSVFNEQGVKIDTDWIKNGSDRGFALARVGPYDETLEPQAFVTFFVGRRDAGTPYPFTPRGCDPSPPPEPIIDKTKIGECQFTYRVRDTKGNEASGSRIWAVFSNCR